VTGVVFAGSRQLQVDQVFREHTHPIDVRHWPTITRSDVATSTNPMLKALNNAARLKTALPDRFRPTPSASPIRRIRLDVCARASKGKLPPRRESVTKSVAASDQILPVSGSKFRT